jgi:hypothetical protein
MKAYSDFVNEQLTKTLDDTQVVEVVEDHLMKEAKNGFPPLNLFLKALEDLSKKYGVIVETKTGLYVEHPSKITDVKYSGDLNKGKLVAHLKTKESTITKEEKTQ